MRAKAAWTRRTCLLKTSRGGRATSGPAERRRAAYSAADITHRVAKTLTETASGSPVKESAEDVVEAVTQAPPVRKEPPALESRDPGGPERRGVEEPPSLEAWVYAREPFEVVYVRIVKYL